ncbi:MAG: hypothetical protein AAGA03_13010, partial [Planctomycetota bacterium]
MTDTASTDTSETTSCEKPAVAARWRRDGNPSGSRGRRIALLSCLLASLLGTLVAVASLPAPKPRVVLVGLYLDPPDQDTFGVDGPHLPSVDRMFGLWPANSLASPDQAHEIEVSNSNASGPISSGNEDAKEGESPSSASDAEVTDGASDDAKNETNTDVDPSAAGKSGEAADTFAPLLELEPTSANGWRTAINSCRHEDQLVLHVSARATVERDQVLLVSADPGTTLTLSEVLEAVAKCPAANQLIVLDVHWPLVSDRGDSGPRLTRLNQAVRRSLSRADTFHGHVLLSSDGTAAARAFVARPRTLLSHYLTMALMAGNADSDDNGRVTLREAVRWARPRIAHASEQRDLPQQIQLISGSNPFVLCQIDGTRPDLRPRYPQWLGEAWRNYQQYTQRDDQPWSQSLAYYWATRLCQLESRWRRGEPDRSLRRRLKDIESNVSIQLESLIAQRCHRRPDSLRLAAVQPCFQAKLAIKDQQSVDDHATALMQNRTEILRSTAAEKRSEAIEAAIKSYVGKLPNQTPAVGLAAVLRTLDAGSRVDRATLEFLVQLSQAWPQPIEYPATDAMKRLLNMDVDSKRIGHVLRLYRLQDLIGQDPAAIALLGHNADSTARQLARVQRLVNNPALTSAAEIDRQLSLGLGVASATLAAQREISSAIRTAELIANAIRIDQESGVRPLESQTLNQVRDDMDAVIESLNELRRDACHHGTLLAGELGLVRQTCESLRRSWEAVIAERTDTLRRKNSRPTNMLSIAISPGHREAYLESAADVEVSSGSGSPYNQSERHFEQQESKGQTWDTIALNRKIDKVMEGSQRIADHWWRHFVSTNCTVASIQSYRRIADRQGIAPDGESVPIEIDGSIRGLNWDHMSQSIQITHHDDTGNAEPIQFEVFQPAASSLKAHPSSGTLNAKQHQTIRFQLTETAGISPGTQLHGAWLHLRCGFHERLIPLKMDAQPAAPSIAIDFGPTAIINGRHVTLPHWPDRMEQPMFWRLSCGDPSIKSVVVQVRDEYGHRLVSTPIASKSGTRSLIEFPPAKKKPAQSGDAGSAPSSGGLVGDLTVVVTDAEKKTTLAQWHVGYDVLDPIRFVSPGWAEYHVESSGQNRLTATFNPTHETINPLNDLSGLRLRLQLEPAATDVMIDYAESKLETTLTGSEGAKMSVRNLRFVEGAEPILDLPVSINGDPGYCHLRGRFPRRPGTVQLDWDRTPSIHLDCKSFVTPNGTLRLQVQSRNLGDKEPLKVDLIRSTNEQTEVVWTRSLTTARELRVQARASQDATLSVLASRYDWSVSIPTHFGTGAYQIRV